MKFTYTLEVEAEEYTGNTEGLPKDFYARQKLLDVFTQAVHSHRTSLMQALARFNPQLPQHSEQTQFYIEVVENDIKEIDKIVKTIKPIININNSIQAALDDLQQDIKVAAVKDVHTEHCCLSCGCKYGDADCSVTTGRKQQSYPCDMCSS